jgi:hypothetical protein
MDYSGGDGTPRPPLLVLDRYLHDLGFGDITPKTLLGEVTEV